MRREDADRALVECAQGQGRFAGADPDDDRHLVEVGQRDVTAEVADLVRAVLAVDDEEVEPTDGEHLHRVLGGQSHQGADQAIAGTQAILQSTHATTPAERSMSAPHMPVMASMATTAAPTSSSVTIRPNAALDLTASTASS